MNQVTLEQKGTEDIDVPGSLWIGGLEETVYMLCHLTGMRPTQWVAVNLATGGNYTAPTDTPIGAVAGLASLSARGRIHISEL